MVKRANREAVPALRPPMALGMAKRFAGWVLHEEIHAVDHARGRTGVAIGIRSADAGQVDANKVPLRPKCVAGGVGYKQ
jgi:hypothetical protein